MNSFMSKHADPISKISIFFNSIILLEFILPPYPIFISFLDNVSYFFNKYFLYLLMLLFIFLLFIISFLPIDLRVSYINIIFFILKLECLTNIRYIE